MIVKMLLSNPFVYDPRVLAEARTLVAHGYDVEVVCWDREVRYPELEHLDGIMVTRVRRQATFGRGPRQAPYFLAFWWGVLCVMRGATADVVHCHDLDTLVPGFLLARRMKTRLVYDSHEHCPAALSTGRGRCVSKMLEAMERVLVRRVDAVITVSELLANRFRALTSTPVHVVGNWKDPERYQIEPGRVRQLARGMGVADRLVISYIGGLNRYRVILPLIEAMRSCPWAFLIVAGDGHQRDLVVRSMRDLDNGVYLGQIELQRVPQYVCLSDVLYYGLDSRSVNNQHSAPNTLFAALAAGKAVLTTPVGEIARIVQEENCGIVLDSVSAESICLALERLRDRTFLHRCQQRARQAGRDKYNWTNAERVLVGVYEGLAACRAEPEAP